jgi:truncated hemoglobin YjbI
MDKRFRWGPALLAAGLLGLGLIGTAGAAGDKEDKPPAAETDSKAVDKQLYEMLRDLHNRGADLYNAGDASGCYRMFQGGLIAVRPALNHHPDIQKMIDLGLADADRNPAAGRRAFALHGLIEEVRAKINPNPKKPDEAKPPKTATLWERLGGEDKVLKVIDDFTALATKNPKVNFDRGGKYKLTEDAIAKFKGQMVAFVSQATGGPFKYTGKSMKEVHKGMGITDAEFDASVADLRKALEMNGAKPADIKELLDKVETTRKDIVEPKKSTDEKTDDKKTDDKKKGDDKKTDDKKKGDDKKTDDKKSEGKKPDKDQ